MAYIVGIPLANAIMNSRLGYDVIQGAYYKILPTTTTFTDLINPDSQVSLTQIKSALTELKIPNFFQGIFTSRVLDYTSDVANAVASSFAYLSIMAACFVLVFLLVFIILKLILKPIWNTIFGEDGKNFLGRIFGVVVSLCKTTLMILVVLWLTSLIDQMMLKYDYDVLHQFLIKDLSLEDTSVFSLGKFFYNTVYSLTAWIGG